MVTNLDVLIERFFAKIDNPFNEVSEDQKVIFLNHLLSVPVEDRESVLERLLLTTGGSD